MDESVNVPAEEIVAEPAVEAEVVAEAVEPEVA